MHEVCGREKAKVTKCLFPVAGLGTRFLPVTKEIAKEMLPLVNRPIISYGVEEALASGCSDIIMITGRAKRSIEDYFDRSFELEQLLKARGKDELHDMVVGISNLAEILYVRQREPLGLGHAVLCGEPFCRGEYFGVVLPDDVFVGDVPVMSQLIDVHDRLGGTVVALERVPRGDVSRYGIVRSEVVEGGIHRILDMVEKPSVDEAPGEYVHIFAIVNHPLHIAVRVSRASERQRLRPVVNLRQMCVQFDCQLIDCGTVFGMEGADCHDYFSLSIEYYAEILMAKPISSLRWI